MKLRILVYGLLALLVSSLTALYLVYSNRDRIIDAASIRLSTLARERWGVELGLPRSVLDLSEGAAVFRDVHLEGPDGEFAVDLERLELGYSLASLLRGEVRFTRIVLVAPRVEIRLAREAPAGEGPAFLPIGRLAAIKGVVDRLRIEGGTLSVLGPDGRSLLAVRGLAVDLSGNRDPMPVRAWADGITLGVGPWHGSFQRGFLKGEVRPGGMAVSRLDLAAGAGSLQGTGRLGADGTIELTLAVNADLGRFERDLTSRFPLTGTVTGTASLIIRGDSWRLEGPVRTRSLTVHGEPIPDAAGRVVLTRGRCLFADLESRVPGGGVITGEGDLSWEPGPFSWGFRVRAEGVPPGRVAYLRRHFDGPWMDDVGPLTGSAAFGSGGGEADGPWEVVLDLSGPAARWFGERDARVTGAIRGRPEGGALLSDFTVDAGSIHGTFSGQAEAEETNLAVVARAEDLADALLPFGLQWLGGKADFGGDVTLREGKLSVAGGVTVENPRVRGVGFQRAHGRLRYRDEAWGLDGLTVTSGTAKAVLGLTVDIAGEARVAADLLMDSVPAVDLARLVGIEGTISGAVSGRVTASGPPDRMSGSGLARSPGMELDGERLEEISADFTFTPRAIDFHSLAATWEGVRASWAGRWERPEGSGRGRVKGSLSADAPSLRTLLPGKGLDGSLSFKGTAEGALPLPAVRGEAVWKGGRIGTADVAAFRVAVETKGRELRAAGTIPGGHRLSVTAGLERPWPVKAVLESDGLRLAEALPFLSPSLSAGVASYLDPEGTRAGGRAQVSLELADAPRFRGEAELADLVLATRTEVSRSRKPVHLAFDREGVTIERSTFEGANHRFSLAGTFGPRTLSADVQGSLDLSFLAGKMPVVSSMDVRPDVSLTITGTPSAPVVVGGARIRGGRLSLARPPRQITDLSADLSFDGRAVVIKSLGASLSPGSVRGSGTWLLKERRLAVLLEGDLPAESVDLTLPGVQEVLGQVVFLATVEGDPSNPVVGAQVSLAQGVVRLSAYPTPLRNVDLRAEVSDEYVRIRHASANLGGGRLEASGYVVLARGDAPGEIDLDVTADRVPLSYRSEFRSVLSAGLRLRGGKRRVLGGRVLLERAKYTRDISPRPTLSLGKTAVPGWKRSMAGMPELAALGLDLSVTSEEGVWIENNVARINAGVDLRVRGTVLEPLISGDVLVRRGDIFYLGKKFTLEDASLSFPGHYPPDPRVSVQASASVTGVTIGLVFQGTLDSLSLDLWSDPPYSREDIISLLTLGAPRNSLENRGRQVSAVGAAMVFSGPVLNRLESRTREFTGLEIFQIEPSLSETGGAARVVVGKTFADRVFVSYARSLSSTGDDQFTMEYQLLDFLSLVGRQDRRGQYSFDLVFSVGGKGWAGR